MTGEMERDEKIWNEQTSQYVKLSNDTVGTLALKLHVR